MPLFYCYTPGTMRRRYVLALVLATALIFAVAGYFAHDLRGNGSHAEDCNAAINYFKAIPQTDAAHDLRVQAGENMQKACT